VQEPTISHIESAYLCASQLIRIISFSLSTCFTIHRGKTSRLDVEAPGSFKISASVLEATTSRLGLGSEGLVHIPAKMTFNKSHIGMCMVTRGTLSPSKSPGEAGVGRGQGGALTPSGAVRCIAQCVCLPSSHWLIVPTHWGLAWLSWPGWLNSIPLTVTHLSTNPT